MSRTFTPLEPIDYVILKEISNYTEGFKLELEGKPSVDSEIHEVWKITFEGNTLHSYVCDSKISYLKSLDGSYPLEIVDRIERMFEGDFWDDDTLELIEKIHKERFPELKRNRYIEVVTGIITIIGVILTFKYGNFR